MITTRAAIQEDLPILLEFEQGLINFERPFDPTLKDEKISYYDIKAMILSDDVQNASSVLVLVRRLLTEFVKFSLISTPGCLHIGVLVT